MLLPVPLSWAGIRQNSHTERCCGEGLGSTASGNLTCLENESHGDGSPTQIKMGIHTALVKTFHKAAKPRLSTSADEWI